MIRAHGLRACFYAGLGLAKAHPVVTAFSVALFIRLLNLAFSWNNVPNWHVDAVGYHQLALNLLNHRVFSMYADPPFQPDSLRTPGYPLFIAFIYAVAGVIPQYVLVAQAIFDAVTAALVSAILLRLGGSTSRAILGGLFYAIFPTAWGYVLQFYVETLLAFVIALAFFVLILPVRGRVVWLGFFAALAIYLKPNAFILPVIMGMLLLIPFKHNADARLGARIASTGLFAIVFLALLSPWMIRNTVVFGRPMVSSMFEFNLATISAPYTLAEVRGQDLAPWSDPRSDLYQQVIEQATGANPSLFIIPRAQMTTQQTDQADRELALAGWQVIRSYPREFLSSHIKGALRGWLPQEHKVWYEIVTGNSWEQTVPDQMNRLILKGQWSRVPPVALAMYIFFALVYLTLFVAVLRGVWRLGKRLPWLVGAMVVTILYMTFLPGPIAYDRFHVPIMPLVMVLAAFA